MKIEIAQTSTDPGCIKDNTAKIIRVIENAREQDVSLLIFPELAVPGYMSMDLVLYQSFVEENLKALEDIARHTQDITVIAGFIDQDEKRIGPDGTPTRYNSAAIIQSGEVLGVEDKSLLPNYDVFYESRYFAPARERTVYQCEGVKIGVEICEDLWDENYPIKVSDDLVRRGAQLIINLSASPFYIDKRRVRERLVEGVVREHKVPFIYVNTIGSQDGYDGQLVFDGQSLVYSADGKLVGLGKAFQEDNLIIDLDNLTPVEPSEPEPTVQLHDALVLGIKEYFRRTGFQRAIIGLSGGIDSAVVAALAAEALGPENIKGISMPSQFSSPGSVADAEELASNLGINFKVIPIERAFAEFEQALSEEFAGLEQDVTEENIQARVRGIILMAEANKFHSLVISTGNKTETALGYTTLYGDMCGGLAAISDVNKVRVYELVRYVNQKAEKELIPQCIIHKAPSAELCFGQTDEASLGAPYNIVSPIVDLLIEDRRTVADLSKIYPPLIVEHLAELIKINEYKRRQAPPGIKVTPKAFGIGRRIPIAHKFRG